MLHCNFPLGRPLGRPDDPVFQHRVLAAALGLLDRTDVPVLVDFDETITDQADQPLACSLPPRYDPTMHPAVDEAYGLRAAYTRRLAATGTTNVKRLGGADRIPELVAVFVAIVEGAAWDEVGLEPAQLGQAALDIRAYYEEAALALVEHVPAARQAESWFYRSTQSGALLRAAQPIIRTAEAPRSAWFPLVPTGQPQPRTTDS
jgi:hypothetical protein